MRLGASHQPPSGTVIARCRRGVPNDSKITPSIPVTRVPALPTDDLLGHEQLDRLRPIRVNLIRN